MAGAWHMYKKAQVRTYGDNLIVLVGFQKIRSPIRRDGAGVAPKFNRSVDL